MKREETDIRQAGRTKMRQRSLNQKILPMIEKRPKALNINIRRAVKPPVERLRAIRIGKIYRLIGKFYRLIGKFYRFMDSKKGLESVNFTDCV